MRTHARYELQQDSASSLEEPAAASSLDSPHSVGSGLVTSSRSVSSESAEPPYFTPTPASNRDSNMVDEEQEQEEAAKNKPPSPMDTQEEKDLSD